MNKRIIFAHIVAEKILLSSALFSRANTTLLVAERLNPKSTIRQA